MYYVIEGLLIITILSGVIYVIRLKSKYNNDSQSREDIIKYFKDNGAVSLDSGIKVKDLPDYISRNPFLLMMVKDKTLIFKNGKYYLNEN